MARPTQAINLADHDPEGMTREEALAGIRASAKVEAWAQARSARFVRYLKDVPSDPADPAKDEADRLRREQNISRGEANKRAKTAEQLGHLPETQDALENGDITGDHASAIADARAKADNQAKAALVAAEHDLLAKARDESPPEFRKRLERFIADHRADAGLADHDRQKARASLRFWNDRDGMKRMTGTFDPDLGATIEHEVRRKSEEAWRAERAGRGEGPAPQSVITHERRMAEALGEICHHIDPFEPSGLTNLANLTPACDHCHDLVHRKGWGVTKDNHGVVTSWAPDGQTWTHHPRDRRQRRERPTQPQPAAAPEYQQSVLV